ncbi:hypothetical protein EYF80_057962 [Liparis tanakae]|uniref:Uncharacterized protein n=1 Tax=Liparis tanakae TaxID=230148 RepID=A0A4Z2ETI3_9TELE|nr:hypothetical protein EYF80_057962 [Liparis tanakae]
MDSKVKRTITKRDGTNQSSFTCRGVRPVAHLLVSVAALILGLFVAPGDQVGHRAGRLAPPSRTGRSPGWCAAPPWRSLHKDRGAESKTCDLRPNLKWRPLTFHDVDDHEAHEGRQHHVGGRVHGDRPADAVANQDDRGRSLTVAGSDHIGYVAGAKTRDHREAELQRPASRGPPPEACLQRPASRGPPPEARLQVQEQEVGLTVPPQVHGQDPAAHSAGDRRLKHRDTELTFGRRPACRRRRTHAEDGPGQRGVAAAVQQQQQRPGGAAPVHPVGVGVRRRAHVLHALEVLAPRHRGVVGRQQGAACRGLALQLLPVSQ